MDEKKLVHQLLYHALIAIREAAYEGNSQIAFALSDLFHNIPLQLARILEEGGTYDEILTWLRMRAQQKGCESWLNNAIAHYSEEEK